MPQNSLAIISTKYILKLYFSLRYTLYIYAIPYSLIYLFQILKEAVIEVTEIKTLPQNTRIYKGPLRPYCLNSVYSTSSKITFLKTVTLENARGLIALVQKDGRAPEKAKKRAAIE